MQKSTHKCDNLRKKKTLKKKMGVSLIELRFELQKTVNTVK
jgi:hypothetical protein